MGRFMGSFEDIRLDLVAFSEKIFSKCSHPNNEKRESSPSTDA
jgi:hypothetical protein